MKKILYTLIIAVSILFTGCSEFLEELPTTVITPKLTSDYDEMLNSELMIRSMPGEYIHMSDMPEYFVNFISAPKDYAYFWDVDNMYETDDPFIWNNPYKKIYTYNTIITQVLDSEGGNNALKKELQAEAKLGKAFELFYLANTFCKQYDPTTASSDLGVPIVNTIDIAAKVPGRGTLQETYDFIINTTLEAIHDLPIDNIDNYRGSQLACNALLARTYYYMSDYENAEIYAQKALDIRGEVLNLNSVSGFANIQLSENQEEFYGRVLASEGIAGPRFNFVMSQSTQALYDVPNDLRFQNDNYFDLDRFGTYFNQRALNSGFSVQEMLFIKAEAIAHDNRLSEALTIVNDFVRTRVNSSYIDYASNNKEEVLTWIRKERSKELYLRGLRWFDMRKLSKEGVMPDLSRDFFNFFTRETTTFTLKGDSKKYTLLIPNQVIGFNPDMPQNDR